MGALVNIFVPGLGHLIQGRVITGAVLFVLVAIGYVCFIIPGLVLHVLAIYDAAVYEGNKQKKAHKELLSALSQSRNGH